jgi:hypothetical protein
MEEKSKCEIPKYDPYTGELNPYYPSEEEIPEEITPENWDRYSPYCPVCSGCGEDGCCSAMVCKQNPEGHYCETYLKDLKFGYKMYRKLLGLIEEDEKYREQVNRIWDETWDSIYDIKDKEEEDLPD